MATAKKSLREKLFAIQQKGVAVAKDGKNPHFKSAYQTLDGINDVVVPMCSDVGLLITHHCDVIGDGIVLTTEVLDIDSEEKISSQFGLYNSDPQKRGSEITYGKRYNLGAIFNIVTEVDDDGNSSSGENFEKKKGLAPQKWVGYSEYKEIASFAKSLEEIGEFVKSNNLSVSNNVKRILANFIKTGEVLSEDDFKEQSFKK